MPIKHKQSDNYKFTVHMEPTVLQSNPTVQTGAWAIVRDDNNAVVGNVSDRYGIVQNEQLMDSARAQFQKMGILDGVEERIFVVGKGERMFAEFTFKQHKDAQLEVQKGDVLGYRVIFRNSFNGSQKVSLSLGFMRLICKNGMTGMSPELSIMQKHHKKVALEFLPDAVEKAFASATSEANIFADLAARGIEMEQGQRILANLAEAGAMSARLAKAIEPVWLHAPYVEDEARNLYNLYNAVTYVLSREVEKSNYALASRVNFGVLNQLLKAARDMDALNLLSVKPKNDEAVSVILVSGTENAS